MLNNQVRVTPDAGLATEAAILNRIALLRQTPTQANARRVQALKARLPRQVGEAILPIVNAAMLVGKNELEWGDRQVAIAR